MSTKKIIIFLLILLLPSTAALLVPGYFGASDEMHIGWLHQMYHALSLGQFPVRFVPDLIYGFGYPLFNFVFPLPFYTGSIFHFFGFSLVDSIKIVLGLSLVASGLAMYWSLCKQLGFQAAFLAALIYVYTPYRATDVYVRGAVGESLAFVFLPIILGCILRISDTPKPKYVSLGAFGVCGLVLTHNIVAYMAAAIFSVLAFFSVKNPQKTILLFSTALAGLGMSAFFWIPAILDSYLMRYDTVYNFVDHFPTMRQLFTPNWGWGASVPGPYDGMSFFVGSAVLFAITSLLALMFTKRKLKNIKLIWWVIGVFFASIFIMNHRSAFIWESLPFIGYFQFPWRFLTLTTLSGAVAAALIINYLNISFKKVIIISLLIVITEIYKFRPNDFLGRTDEYYIDRYIPVPQASQQYRQTSTDYLRLPKDSQTPPKETQPLFSCNPECLIEITDENPLAARALIKTSSETLVSFNKLNFPGWIIEIDPKMSTQLGSGEFGQSVFILPSGEYSILVKFTQTDRNILLLLVSVLTISFSMILLLKPTRP